MKKKIVIILEKQVKVPRLGPKHDSFYMTLIMMKLLNFWLLYLPTFGTSDYNYGRNYFCSPTVHA